MGLSLINLSLVYGFLNLFVPDTSAALMSASDDIGHLFYLGYPCCHEIAICYCHFGEICLLHQEWYSVGPTFRHTASSARHTYTKGPIDRLGQTKLLAEIEMLICMSHVDSNIPLHFMSLGRPWEPLKAGQASLSMKIFPH